jgi:hypothetical protein
VARNVVARTMSGNCRRNWPLQQLRAHSPESSDNPAGRQLARGRPGRCDEWHVRSFATGWRRCVDDHLTQLHDFEPELPRFVLQQARLPSQPRCPAEPTFC